MGWVEILYAIPEAGELPVENGRQILRVPEAGVLKTKSTVMCDWGEDTEHYYESGARLDTGDVDMIQGWSRRGSLDGSPMTSETFFVGTLEQFTLLETDPEQPKPIEKSRLRALGLTK